MRRVLFLVLFLGSISIANAGLLDLMVDGGVAPDEITLMPSDTVSLGVFLPAGNGCYDYYLAFQLSNPQAEIDASNAVFPTIFEIPGVVGVNEPGYVEITASQIILPDPQGPSILADNIFLHCLGPGDVVLDLVTYRVSWINGEMPAKGTVIDTLTIHQVPEPMTLTLMALGGLLLRRRR